MPAGRADVTVVGAGWAGLAAAIHLVKGGRSVRLIDAAPQAGGRARRITLDWQHPLEGRHPVELDNGQHLLLGAYTEVLALLDLIDATDHAHLERRPMRLAGSSGLLMERTRFGDGGPGAFGSRIAGAVLTPLSPLLALAGAHGLSAAARWAMVRALGQLRFSDWRTPAGVTTVSDWYLHARQPAELIERVWQPLAISALNTPADSACATTFLTVLRDSLGGKPGASDFLLPRQNLSHLFVDPAIAWLRRHGAVLMLRSDVRRIERGAATRFRVVVSARAAEDPVVLDCDRLILATPPYVTARLLDGLADTALVGELRRFQYLPITTAYVGWPDGGRDARPDADAGQHGPAGLVLPALLALRESAPQQRFAQWFFDRGRQSHWRVGALVVSDSRAALELGEGPLSEALVRQVSDDIGVPAPAQISLIHEKRATFACTPDRPRLAVDAASSRLPGLALAGDYTYVDYPATLEGAVRSGRAAASAILLR